MRMSRVLLAGAAVAAAGIATSAFTAGNTVQPTVAGYGDAAVTGATTENIDYVLDGADKSEITSINFDVTENFDAAVVQGLVAWLQLQQANGDPVGSALPCVIGSFATDHTPITCALPADTKIASFNRIGLTVSE